MSNDNVKQYSDAELKKMSNEELARLGTELDGVTVAYRKERFPVEDDPAEKRAAAHLNIWLGLSIICSLAFLGVYLFWPWNWKGHGDEGLMAYTVYTPLLGLTSGLAIVFLGIFAVQFVKTMVPAEVSVQTRHDGRSSEVDRRTITALLDDAWTTSTLGRRKMMMGLLGGSAALVGLVLVSPVGGMVHNPWRRHELTYEGDGTLWTSGWTLHETGVKLYLGRDTGAVAEERKTDTGTRWEIDGISRLVRVRPEDLAAGGMETVYPLAAEDVNDGDLYDSHAHVYHRHMESLHGPRNSVMLIRLRTEDAKRAIEREGQEDFHYGDFYAYSKICTHVACPTSLYEQQTNRILCPCHQSQFDALQHGKPVFGPAARALPQLPITVDEEGYLIAAGNFIEPVGPAFWERKS